MAPKGARRGKGKKVETTLKSLMTLCNSPTTDIITKLTSLHQRLRTLKSVQPARSIIPKRTTESLNRLLECHTSTAPFKAVFTDSDQSNATLMSTRDIAEGETIVKIPVSSGFTDVIPAELMELTNHLPVGEDASLRLTLNLLYYCGKGDNEQKVYIEALPSRFENLLTYPVEFVCMLPRRLQDKVLRVLSTHARIYCMVYNTLRRLDNEFSQVFTWMNYEWASGVVLSRQNWLCDKLGLIPVWDMIEHDEKSVTSEIVEDDGRMYVTLVSSGLETGRMISMNYGNRGNEELLLYAGFVVEENSHDVIEIVIPIEDDTAVLKGRILRKVGYGTVEEGGIAVVVKVGNGGCEELLKVLRVVVMDKTGLVEVMRDGVLPNRCEQDDEAKRLLERIVNKLLEEHDELLSKATDERAKTLLRGERRVLLSLIR